MKETRKLKKSPVTLKAIDQEKKIDDHLVLRKNNSFAYTGVVLGMRKSVYYAGTFKKNGDSLFLNFHNNHKDSSWTGVAVIDSIKKEITLISTDTHFNKKMTITKLK